MKRIIKYIRFLFTPSVKGWEMLIDVTKMSLGPSYLCRCDKCHCGGDLDTGPH